VTRPRDLRRLLARAITLGSTGALLVACRKDAPRTEGTDAPHASGVETSPADGTAVPVVPPDESAFDAGAQASRGVEARADETRRDAGAIEPACAGAALSLLGAAVDPRCAVTDREWDDLVRAFGSVEAEARAGAPNARAVKRPRANAEPMLRHEARRDGDAIVVSIVNRGSAPISVPLRYHPGHPELAFSVLAEPAGGRGVFELVPPKYDVPEQAPATARGRHPLRGVLVELDGGSAFSRVHSARIRLAPGGAARARLVIDPRIAKRLDRACSDAGARPSGAGDGAGSECLPARLPSGRTVLHVGQLVTGIDAGEPARVEWDAP